MSKILLVTYGGDSCFFEKIDKQQAHTERVTKWLNSGTEISVMAFCLDGESGLDMLVAIGECSHRDLLNSVFDRDMNFKIEKKKYKVGGDIGGFCAKKNGRDVVFTRDSKDFGRIRSAVGNIHRQMILHRLNQMLKMSNLSGNRKTRKASSPQCEKPILSFADQLKKLGAWKKAYDGWKYKNKGGFPEVPTDILEQAEKAPAFDGFRPAVEINFYLSTVQEHLDFVMRVLWPLALKKKCDIYGGSSELSTPALKDGLEWPGKSVAVVGIDIEAYMEEEGTSAWQVRELETNPIHVEIFTHLMMHGLEYRYLGGVPGLNMTEGHYTRIGYRFVSDGDGVAIDGNEECLSGFIASRMF